MNSSTSLRPPFRASRGLLLDADKAVIAMAVSREPQDEAMLAELASYANGHPEVARVLDAVSLWLTGTARALAQEVDQQTHPDYRATPSLEALICDVEGLRSKLGH